MTNKDAIEVLKQQKYPYPAYPKDIEVNEAIDLAINALEERPIIDIQETDTVKELRQQLARKEAEINEAVKVIAKLVCRNAPTVFDCRSCKHNGNERECNDCHEYSNYVHYEKRPQGKWENITSSNHFTPGGDPVMRCPFCKDRESVHLGGTEGLPWKFCPICGADMRGESDDETN